MMLVENKYSTCRLDHHMKEAQHVFWSEFHPAYQEPQTLWEHIPMRNQFALDFEKPPSS